MVVNKLRRRLDRAEWQITVVDQNDTHVYQPGFLVVPFGGEWDDGLARQLATAIGIELTAGLRQGRSWSQPPRGRTPAARQPARPGRLRA